MSMRVKELLALGEKQLRECGIDDAETDSKLLYCFLRNIPRSRLILEYQIVLQDQHCEHYFRLLDERCAGRPLQYIVGTQDFMGLTFKVNESVLIPRMDTEILVENALSVIDENKLNGNDLALSPRKSWDVLDLCTGSGSIAVSVAKLAKTPVKVCASDISEEALSVAKTNGERNRVQVEFQQGDLLDPWQGRFRKRKFDMIISNPPYVRTAEIGRLQREIREHEPVLALDGGGDGLDLYRRIAVKAPEFLKKQGVLMMEIGWDQREDVTRLLESAGKFEQITCVKDLARLDRVIFAVLR